MSAFEILRGVAPDDEHYAYLAIRPPLQLKELTEFEQEVIEQANTLGIPSTLGIRSTLEGDETNEAMVFEIQTLRVVDRERLNKLTAILLKHAPVEITDSEVLPYILKVKGDTPLFEQYEAQWQTAPAHS